jgi:hypothetical protein
VAQVQFDVPYSDHRNRLTVAFRYILAIPHLIVANALAFAVQVVSYIQWFIELFTGKRNQALTEFTAFYIDYYGRVLGYVGLLHDEFPEFVANQGKTPVRAAFAYELEPVNRLTVGLRFVWAIPAFLTAFVLGIALFFVEIAAWFTILVTGRTSPGMHAFIVRCTRFVLQVVAYQYLATDQYPQYGGGATTAAGSSPGQLPGAPWPAAPTYSTPGPGSQPSGFMLPPPPMGSTPPPPPPPPQ